MSTSICAEESFQLLNAGARSVWRGKGDTWTAARNRAAEEAGLTHSQGERLEKNWRTMRFPNGDVYRLLRNAYGHLCQGIENKADAIEREAQKIEETNEALRGHQTPMARREAAASGAEGAR
jgi:hypothetical protein